MPTGDPQPCNCCCHKPLKFEPIVEKNPKWEYTMNSTSGWMATKDGSNPTLIEELDELGKEGWEAYAHIVNEEGNYLTFLKRRI